MSNSRQAFLTSLGATLTDDGHCHFGEDSPSATLPDNFISPLSHYGLLLTEGPDSAKFLQGQTTCNFNEINDQQSRLGAYCTAKGRMVSSFLVARSDEEHYWMRMRQDIVDATRDRFGKYIVFSKAEQSNQTEQMIVLGLYGPKAQTAISSAFGDCPSSQWQSLNKDGQLVIQTNEQGNSFECWIPAESIEKLWPLLSADLPVAGSETWQLLTIQQGLGDVSSHTLEEFIPQSLNYPLIGAVSFDKGCYTGQEVVARMHYRGKSKRATYRIALTGDKPAEGQELYSTGEQSIGNIVNVATTGDGNYQALAVLTHKETDKEIHRGDSSSPVEILPLPYAITDEAE